jgi:TatD DNase family protein
MKVISGRSLDLVDAHMHLPSYPDPDPLVRLATSSGALLLSCTVNSSEAETNLRLRREYPATVRCFLGVHPSDAGEELPSSSLGEAVAAADGVGEIGLDAKYSDASPGSLQVKAFLDQLALAERFQKPVQVHSRGSEKERSSSERSSRRDTSFPRVQRSSIRRRSGGWLRRSLRRGC